MCKLTHPGHAFDGGAEAPGELDSERRAAVARVVEAEHPVSSMVDA
jgi:hypothetical protein